MKRKDKGRLVGIEMMLTPNLTELGTDVASRAREATGACLKMVAKPHTALRLGSKWSRDGRPFAIVAPAGPGLFMATASKPDTVVPVVVCGAKRDAAQEMRVANMVMPRGVLRRLNFVLGRT